MHKRLITAVLLLATFAALSTVTPAPGRKYVGPRSADNARSSAAAVIRSRPKWSGFPARACI